MKLKVCGLKYNIAEVANLQPDYLGFIFYEKSPRFFEHTIPKIPNNIKKVGVFVDASLDFVKVNISKYNLDLIQLHGNESPEFCNSIKSFGKKIIKVFSVKDLFDFSLLKHYESACDYYLFDTKGTLPGGNGYMFNWNILANYPSTKPFFLSGGIGLNQIEKLKQFKKANLSKYCHAIDVNSKFEIEPGLKNINDLERFKNELSY